MADVFTQFQGLGAFFTIGGWVVAGIFVVLGFFGRGEASRRAENDKLADSVISRQKEDNEQKGKQIAALTIDLEQTKKDLHQLQGRNTLLEELFKGRDPAMQTFLATAPRLIQIAEDNNNLAKATNASVGQMATALTELMTRLAQPEPSPQLTMTP